MAGQAHSVELTIGVASELEAPLPLTVEATYSRQIPVEGSREKTALVEDTRQFLVEVSRKTTVTFEDVAAGSTIGLILFAGDRTIQVRREVVVDNRALDVSLTAAEVKHLDSVTVVREVRPAPVLRSARFFSLQAQSPDYRRSALNVAPVRLGADWQRLALANLLHIQQPATASVEWLAGGWPEFGDVAWTPVHLEVDGRFTPAFPKGAGDAWLWWLNGTRSAIGLVIDDLREDRRETISIALPAFAVPLGSDPLEDPEHAPGVRVDPTEAELVNNPGIFTEDPGAFCKPFSNPERILSERPFYTVFRVDQPVISAEPTTKLQVAGVFDFDADDRAAVADDSSVGVRSLLAMPWGKLNNVYVKPAGLPSPYSSGLETLDRGRKEISGTNPVQWEGDAVRYQAATLARGHILEYRVRWRSNGYSLGTVSKTLTLAPRQVRRIQKIDWARTERSRRTESTQFAEEVSDETTRQRSYDNAVQSNLSEWARGESSASQTGVAGGIGFALGPVVIGGGAAHSNATGSSSQSGGRSISASEEQNLRDSIRRFGDSLRRFESVVVNEVTQQESVTGTTEIVRNPNYGHSLTVIYYQILRHLRVDTEFAGVRECLFVPFAMKPFTIERVHRWRDTLQNRLLDRQYLFALRYLKDVMANFVGSTIPAGARADQPLTSLHGSIYVNLAIERPQDAADNAFAPTNWSVLSSFLGAPALEVFSRLQALQAHVRDAVFQRDHAPRIAANWADTLQLSAGNQPLAADFTLASAYRFNNSVRIDFTVDLSRTPNITRRILSNLKLTALRPLSPGSVANLTRISYNYQTNSYQRSVSVEQGVNDLINVVTGAVDPAGASVTRQPDSWELQNARTEISLAVKNLLQHLNEHIEHYHKVIWWYMDRDRLYMLLDGFYVPGTPTISIASVVEREPIAIVGNALVFRVSAGSFLGWGKYDTPQKIYDYYWGNQPARDPLYVSLPTDGLYAQTIMDECLALEEHKGDIDWVLDDPDPELGDLDPALLASRRAEPQPTTPTQLPTTLINLQNAPAAPDPSGLAGALGAVTNANAFRDMAGLAATQANAAAAMSTAAGLATNFGNQAAALQLAKTAKADQATQTANQKLASIKNAKDKGLTDDAGAAAQAEKVLSAMNPDANSAEAPHQNAAINSAIDAAKAVKGSTVEASTAEGAVKVTLGNAPVHLASLGNLPVQKHCAFWDATGTPLTEAAVREAVRAAAVAERANWFDAAGNAIAESDAGQFGHLVRYWLGRFGDIPPLALTALQARAVDGTVNYGALTVAATAAPAVETEVVRVRDDLMTVVPATAPATVRGRVEAAVRSARLSGYITPAADRTAWSAVFVSSTVRRAAMQLGLEAEVGGQHVGRNALLLGHDAHRVYAAEAFNRGTNGTGGTYHAFEPARRPIQVGDIIVQDRQANNIGHVWAFEALPRLATEGRRTHADIVVEVQAGGTDVVAIGGNLGDGSRRRRYPVAADGTLIVTREQRYTQETVAGVLPPIAPPNAAAGLTLSTGRIFAVLSPVPLCVVIPGQSVGDGTFIV